MHAYWVVVTLGLAATLTGQAPTHPGNAQRALVPVSSNFTIIQQQQTEHPDVNLCGQEFATGDSGAWWASDEEPTSVEQAGGKGSGCVGLSGVSLVVQRGGNDSNDLPKFIVVRDDIAAGQYDYSGLNHTGTEWLELMPGLATLSTPGTFDATDAFAVVEVGGTTYLFNPSLGWSNLATAGLTRVGFDGSLAECFVNGTQIIGVSSLVGTPRTIMGFVGPVTLQVPSVTSTSALMFHVGANDLRAFSAYSDAWTTIATVLAAPPVAYGENLVVIADGAQTIFYSSFTGNVSIYPGAVTPSITANCATWIDAGIGYVYRPCDDMILSAGPATVALQGDEWGGFVFGTTTQLVSTQLAGVGFAPLNLGAQVQRKSSHGGTNVIIATDTMLHGYSSYTNSWASTASPNTGNQVLAGPQVGSVVCCQNEPHRDTPGVFGPILFPAGPRHALPPEPEQRRVYAFSPREAIWSTTERTVEEVRTSDRIVLARSGNVFSAFGTESRGFMVLAVLGSVVDWGVEKAYGYVQTPTELHAFSTITDRWYSATITTPNPEVFHNGRVLTMVEGSKLTQFRAMPDIQPATEWGTGLTPGLRQRFTPGVAVSIEALGPENAAHSLLLNFFRAAAPVSLPGVSGLLEVEPTGLITFPVGTFSAKGTNTINLLLPAVPFPTSAFYMQTLAFDGITMQLGQLLPYTVQ